MVERFIGQGPRHYALEDANSTSYHVHVDIILCVRKPREILQPTTYVRYSDLSEILHHLFVDSSHFETAVYIDYFRFQLVLR